MLINDIINMKVSNSAQHLRNRGKSQLQRYAYPYCQLMNHQNKEPQIIRKFIVWVL